MLKYLQADSVYMHVHAVCIMIYNFLYEHAVNTLATCGFIVM